MALKIIAWMNFTLALAGLLKFLPITYLIVLSAWRPPLDSDLLWSVDLISDTYLIVLVWLAVAFRLKKESGRAMILPWR
ncbi:hypothetical protein N8718_01360 [Luminiphilus sp.]|nr:hypothetical protein [Luminiphilus sp.]MDA8755016.1 hypothetical protein [Luminiphilus sp.]MDA8947190.1 hypothetical protein [Luminiphilus sp.]MDB2556620.1 hypothetical protein [Luminiphilus sp.]MDB3899884.1 hypothetical protein [Luminiphilus sp.]